MNFIFKGSPSGAKKRRRYKHSRPHKKLSILYSFHKEFSKVMSLSTLFEEIYSINPAFKKIVLNVGIIIDINHKDNKFDKPKNEFLLFYSKTIIYFSIKDNISYDYFSNQIQNINCFEINSEVKILNLLADSSTFFIKKYLFI